MQKLDMVTPVIHRYSRLLQRASLKKLTTGIVSAGASAGMTKVAVFANVGAGEGGGVT